MKKTKIKKYILNLVVLLIIFSCFYTDGYGFIPIYEHGKTINDAINFYYNNNMSDIQLKEVIDKVEIEENKFLILYKDNYNILNISLVKKRWNSRWKVVDKNRGLAFDYKLTPTWKYSKNKPKTHWMWSGLKNEDSVLPVFYGIIYSDKVAEITVYNKKANIIHKDNYNIWYKIEELYNSYDVKAYDNNGKLIEKYPD